MAQSELAGKPAPEHLLIDIDELKRLLESAECEPGDLRERDYNGRSLLLTCAREGHVEAAKLLLHHGADVNVPNNDGWTALHAAAYAADTRCVALLLKAGAAARVVDGSGQSPVMAPSAAPAPNCSGIGATVQTKRPTWWHRPSKAPMKTGLVGLPTPFSGQT